VLHDHLPAVAHKAAAAPGGLLLHPASLLAVGILALNDHVLKAAAPGLVTGKLSDLAGLVFFPLLLTSIIEVMWALAGRRTPSRPLLVICLIAITVALFTLVKTTTMGSGALAWFLGTAQWVVSLGAFAGRVAEPVSVVADPTDLVALPAVLAAWWIATAGSATRSGSGSQKPIRAVSPLTRPSLRTLLVMIAAGLATLATSQAPASSSTDHEETIRLTAAQPVAARHLSFQVDSRDPGVSSVHLLVEAWTKEDQEGMEVLVPPPNLQVSLIPDEPANHVSSDDEMFEPPALDLTDLCLPACRNGATTILRLTGDPPQKGLDVEFHVSLVAMSDDFDRTSLDVDLALGSDADRRFDGDPPTVVARTERTFRVGNDQVRARHQVHLRVVPEVLEGPLAFPLVGRLITGIETTRASGHPNAHNTSITVGDEMRFAVTEDQRPFDFDWLSHCKPSTACEITISLDAEYDSTMNSDDFEPNDDPGFVEIRWFVEARLEAFDGRALPKGALLLVED
jgi:hypothetical protein